MKRILLLVVMHTLVMMSFRSFSHERKAAGASSDGDTIKNGLVSPGEIAPELSVPDLYGKVAVITDFRGKYVVLDFWASWCGPCRKLNPELVRLYNQYKGPEWELLGISIDTDRSAWYQAVKKDGLPWRNFCDLKGETGAAAAYVAYEVAGVRAVAVPQNYVIDPEGKVVAKNVHGPELEKILEEITAKRN